jgi:hypothetical protein
MVSKECDSTRITSSLVTRVHCLVITLQRSVANRKHAGKMIPSGRPSVIARIFNILVISGKCFLQIQPKFCDVKVHVHVSAD